MTDKIGVETVEALDALILLQRKRYNNMKGELEDICGQLGDIEGEYQKTAEEAIKRIQELIE